MSDPTFLLNKALKQIEQLEKRIKDLEAGGASGGTITAEKAIIEKDITIGPTALPILYLTSNANAGDTGYIYAFKESGGTMKLQFVGFDLIEATSPGGGTKQLYP